MDNLEVATMGKAEPNKSCSGRGSRWAEDYNNALMGQTKASCDAACVASEACLGTSFGSKDHIYAGTCVLCTSTIMEDRSTQQDWTWSPKSNGPPR